MSTIAGKAGISGVADGVGTSAQFNAPSGVALTAAGDFVLIADWQNSAIRKLVVATATVTTLAGVRGTTGRADGTGTAATFQLPVGVTMDALGSIAVVADSNNHLVRLVTISSGAVVTLAGQGGVSGTSDGIGTSSRFNSPFGATLDAAGSFALIVSTRMQRGLYAFHGNPLNQPSHNPQADRISHTIRKVNVSTSTVTTLAGTALTSGRVDGVGTSARFWDPSVCAFGAWDTIALVVSVCSSADPIPL